MINKKEMPRKKGRDHGQLRIYRKRKERRAYSSSPNGKNHQKMRKDTIQQDKTCMRKSQKGAKRIPLDLCPNMVVIHPNKQR